MGFYKERTIKSIRKPRHCDGCGVKLGAGETALQCTGVSDDGFWTAVYHHDCRKAEEGLNRLHETGWYDEWISLSDIDWEDWPWLIKKFPAVAARKNITIERFENVQAEREATRKAWAEIDRKRWAERHSPPTPTNPS